MKLSWFLPLTLWMSSASADISLTLRNNQYIPPPIQELPINENYFKAQQQERFKQNSNDNSKYQLFEVRSHYKVSGDGGGRTKLKSLEKQTSFANKNYVLSSPDKKIRFEHINAPAGFPLDDPSLDVSYLSFAVGSDDRKPKIIVQHETKNNIQVPFPSNFRHTFPEKSQNDAPQSLPSRGPGYLPPTSQAQQYFIQPVQKPQPAQDYRAREQRDHSTAIQDSSSYQIVNNNNKDTFKGLDYLPPLQQNPALTLQSSIQLSSQQQHGEGFKGLEFLPQEQHFSSQSYQSLKHSSPFKGSKYEPHYQPGLSQNSISELHFKSPEHLPPPTNVKISDYLFPPPGATKQQMDKPFRPSQQYFPPENSQDISDISRDQITERNNVFRGSNNLQPQHETIHSYNSFKAPDYLPPHQSQTTAPFKDTENLKLQSEAEHSSNPFKGPDYLPPQQSQIKAPFRDPENLQAQHETKQSNNPFKGPDYLPPDQSQIKVPFNGSGNLQLQPEANYSNNPFKGPDYLPPHQSQIKAAERGPENLQPQHETKQYNHPFKGPDYSPLHQSEITASPREPKNLQLQHDSKNSNNPFKGPDYLPPQQSQTKAPFQGTESLRPQHETKQYNNHFKGPDYLPPNENLQVEPQTGHSNNPFKGPDYLPPQITASLKEPENLQLQHGTKNSHNPFKGPDYLPPQQSQTKAPFQGTESLKLQHKTKQSNNPFKGPDYLPPHENLQLEPQTGHSNNPFKAPDYLPPHQFQTSPKNLQPHYETKYSNNAFKGTDYLPPHQSQTTVSFKGPENLQFLPINEQSNNPFKGPDYLPPHQTQIKVPFKGPEYLPPVTNQLQLQEDLPEGYDFIKPPNAQQAIEELHKLPEESAVSQIQIAQSIPPKQLETNSPSEDIPSGYDFQKPKNSEQAIKLLHSQETSTTSSSIHSIQDAQGFLPVYNYQRISNTGKTGNQLKNLNPSLQQFRTKAESIANILQASEQAIDKIQGQQISHKNNHVQVSSPAYRTEPALQQRSAPTNQATDQATNIISQPEIRQFLQSSLPSFKGSNYLPPSQGLRNFKGSEYLPPTLGSQNYRGPDYLPPSSGHLTSIDGLSLTSSTAYAPQNNNSFDFLPSFGPQRESASPLNQKTSTVFKGSGYLPPIYQSTTGNQFKGTNYLPPTEHQTFTMYPLSSYMTNIKPSDRYGNRIPFHEYGVPPAKAVIFSNSNDIASMYRQPTPKPQYYAPAMSYTNNAFHSQISTQYQTTSTLSQQARQTLQTFMPDEIRQTTTTNQFQEPNLVAKTTTTLQAAKPATAKLRTVQIVNPNEVRTLKVLESLDDAGIKTIKILGSSNELPQGEHRVVKVVSGSNEQSVQTLKIFNDHQDLVTNGNAASTALKGNSYLPPRSKRNPTSKPSA